MVFARAILVGIKPSYISCCSVTKQQQYLHTPFQTEFQWFGRGQIYPRGLNVVPGLRRCIHLCFSNQNPVKYKTSKIYRAHRKKHFDQSEDISCEDCGKVNYTRKDNLAQHYKYIGVYLQQYIGMHLRMTHCNPLLQKNVLHRSGCQFTRIQIIMDGQAYQKSLCCRKCAAPS